MLPKTPGHRADCDCLYCTQASGFRCAVCKCPVNDNGECTSCFDRPTPPATKPTAPQSVDSRNERIARMLEAIAEVIRD